MRVGQHDLFKHLDEQFDQLLRQPLHKQTGCRKKLPHDEYQERVGCKKRKQ